MERRSIETVLRHGWQVIAVSGDGRCDCPEHHGDQRERPAEPGLPFAYTVGLQHRAGVPELLMSGLSPEVMHHALNSVAERVVAGHRFRPGDVIEGVLAGVPVVVERASEEARRDVVLLAGDFHRRKPNALVIVWLTRSGLFAWQPGAPDTLDEVQPTSWREPIVHAGGLATDPEWVFPVPADHLAFACTHVVDDGAPVLFAARVVDNGWGEDWSITCGVRGHPTEELCLVHLAHLVRAAPSLRMVSGLALGEEAIRASVDSGWLVRPVCV